MSREGGEKGEEKSDRGRERGGVELLFPLTTVHNSRPGERGRGRPRFWPLPALLSPRSPAVPPSEPQALIKSIGFALTTKKR